MRIMRVVCVAFVGAAVLSARVAGAQDTREVVLRVHRAGDTVSIRGATVTIDHTIEAGNTDSAGIVRIPDLEDGGHIVEVVARGYQAYFDNFKSGREHPAADPARAPPHCRRRTRRRRRDKKTDLKFAGFDARRSKGQGKFFTRAQLDAASGRPLANLLKTDAGAFFVAGTARGVATRHAVARERVLAVLRRGCPRWRSDLPVRRRQPARPRQNLRRAARRGSSSTRGQPACRPSFGRRDVWRARTLDP